MSQTKLLTVRVPLELVAAVEARAEREQLSMSDAIRKALTQYVNGRPHEEILAAIEAARADLIRRIGELR